MISLPFGMLAYLLSGILSCDAACYIPMLCALVVAMLTA